MEEKNVIGNKFWKQMRKPFVFGILIATVGVILLLITTILRTVVTTNILTVLPTIVHSILIILLGLFYGQKYNEKLSRNLILKTALYSSVFMMIFFLILSIFLVIYKQLSVAIIFALFGFVGFFANFAFVSFNLYISNLISLNKLNIKFFKKITFSLDSDEEVIFVSKRITFKYVIINLFVFICIGLFWYFIGPKIFLKLGFWSLLITIGVLVFLIIDTADTSFFSKFILTNKRLIKRRYLIYNSILVSEVDSLTINTTLDFGFISILNKDGFIFNSPIIANPKLFKTKIENTLVSLKEEL